MKKKITLFLLSLLSSVIAFADYQAYEDNVSGQCWVDDFGVIYKLVGMNDGSQAMALYGYNKPAATAYETPTVPGAPEWDASKECNLEILDYVAGHSVTLISTSAFMSQTNIVSVVIPATISTIEKQAFYGCTSIKEIWCYATTPPEITGLNPFGMGTNSTNAPFAIVHVPYGCKAQYEAIIYADEEKKNKSWGYYATHPEDADVKYFTFEEMEEGAQGPSTQGLLTVWPESSSRISGKLESITISYEGGVELLKSDLEIEVINTDSLRAIAVLKPALEANTDGIYTLYAYDENAIEMTPLTLYGDYTIEIPEGSFSLGEGKISNVKTAILYTIEDDNEYVVTISPKSGYASTTSLSSFEVSCEDGIEQLIAYEINHLYVYRDGDTDAFTYVTKDGDVKDSETIANFVFDTPLSTPGKYTFTFPAGTFRVGPYNQWSEAMEITYYVTDDVEEEEGEWAIYPSDSTAISTISEIQLQYSTGLEIVEEKEGQISITDEKGNTYQNFTLETIYNGIKITLSEEITEPGVYRLYAPQGTFLLGQTKQASDEMTITFTIAQYDIVFSPEDGSVLEEISSFSLLCYESLEYLPDPDDNMYVLNVLKNDEIMAIAIPDEENPILDGDNNIIGYTYYLFDVEDRDEDITLTESGTYTIDVGYNNYLLGPEKVVNKATSCTYIIEEENGDDDDDNDDDDDDESTLIENVTINEFTQGVYYNLLGQRVKNLKKGNIYLINGKKIIIK